MLKKNSIKSLVFTCAFAVVLLAMPVVAGAGVLYERVSNGNPLPAASTLKNFVFGIDFNGSHWVEPTTSWKQNSSFVFVTGDSDNYTNNQVIDNFEVEGATYRVTVKVCAPYVNATYGLNDNCYLAFAATASPVAPAANTTYFFDEGTFVDTNTTATGRFNFVNLAVKGLKKLAGEPAAKYVRIPRTGSTPATDDGMTNNVLQTANLYFENIIFDGLGVNMSQNTATGRYYFTIYPAASNFVFRDVILQNVGANTTVTNSYNVAINMPTAGGISHRTPMHLDRMIIRNIKTMGQRTIIANCPANMYFRNFYVDASQSTGTGNIFDWGGGTAPTLNKVNCENIVFSGSFTGVARRFFMATTGRVDDDFGGYNFNRNIVFPQKIVYRATPTSEDVVTAYRYLDAETPGSEWPGQMPIRQTMPELAANRAILDLYTGYWIVPTTGSGTTSASAYLAKLNEFVNNATFNANTTMPALNIKLVAQGDGTVPAITVPDFGNPLGTANIVAVKTADEIPVAAASSLPADYVSYQSAANAKLTVTNPLANPTIFWNFDFASKIGLEKDNNDNLAKYFSGPVVHTSFGSALFAKIINPTLVVKQAVIDFGDDDGTADGEIFFNTNEIDTTVTSKLSLWRSRDGGAFAPVLDAAVDKAKDGAAGEMVATYHIVSPPPARYYEYFIQYNDGADTFKSNIVLVTKPKEGTGSSSAVVPEALEKTDEPSVFNNVTVSTGTTGNTSCDPITVSTITIPAEVKAQLAALPESITIGSIVVTADTKPEGREVKLQSAGPVVGLELYDTAGKKITAKLNTHVNFTIPYSSSAMAKDIAVYYRHTEGTTTTVTEVGSSDAADFYYTNNGNGTFTFYTKIFSEVEQYNLTLVITPASSGWTLVLLIFIALGVAVFVSRKVTNN